MPKTMIAQVTPDYNDGEYGPNYVMVRLSGDPEPLIEKMDAVMEFAKRFQDGAATLIGGALKSIQFRAYRLPLEIKWFHSTLFYSEDDLPEWLSAVEDEGYIVLDEFEPSGGDMHEFTAVDTEFIRVTPYNTFSVHASVKACGFPFSTWGIPMLALIDMAGLSPTCEK